MEYYVYAHLHPVTLIPFYIGKGRKGRIKSTVGRNQYWRNVVNKYGFIPLIIADGLTEDQAFAIESQYIAKHRLKRDGGTLVNMTYGGEGMAGHQPSKETRLKLSETKIGNRNPNYGKKTWSFGITRSEDCKQKIRDKKLGVKQSEETKRKSLAALEKAKASRQSNMLKIRCLITGTVWLNKWDCINSLGIKETKFKDMTRGKEPDGNRRGIKKLEYLKN